jgi:hypothetical protein
MDQWGACCSGIFRINRAPESCSGVVHRARVSEDSV